jgi:hypothetical protein
VPQRCGVEKGKMKKEPADSHPAGSRLITIPLDIQSNGHLLISSYGFSGRKFGEIFRKFAVHDLCDQHAEVFTRAD